jgi:hypothetical protein
MQPCNASAKQCDIEPVGCITRQKKLAGPYGGMITHTVYIWFCSHHLIDVFPDLFEIPTCLKPLDAIEFVIGEECGPDYLSQELS